MPQTPRLLQTPPRGQLVPTLPCPLMLRSVPLHREPRFHRRVQVNRTLRYRQGRQKIRLGRRLPERRRIQGFPKHRFGLEPRSLLCLPWVRRGLVARWHPRRLKNRGLPYCRQYPVALRGLWPQWTLTLH